MVVALGPGKFYGSSLPRPRFYTDVKLNSERVDPPVPVLDPFLSWANEAHWSMGGLNVTRHRLQGRIEGNIKKLRAESEKIIRNEKRIASKNSALRDTDKSDEKSSRRSASASPPPAPIAKKRRRYMAVIDDEEEEEEEVREEDVKGGGGGDLGDGVRVRRRPARKLGDDFDRVASETVNKQNVITKGSNDNGLGNSSDGLDTVALRTRSRRSEKEDDSINGVVMKVVEEVKRSNTKNKKLKGGNKGTSDGKKGLSPAGGNRTSPRLLKRGSI